MELSFGNRRRAQSSIAWPSQQQSQSQQASSLIASSQHHTQLSQKLLVRKQHSFIEAGSASSGCGYLSRGLSVDRRAAGTSDIGRHKLIVPVSTGAEKATRSNHTSVQHKLSRQVSKSKDSLLFSSNHANHSKASRYAHSVQQRNSGATPVVAAGGGGAGASGAKVGRHIVAWCSTSSLLKTIDAELSQVNGALQRKHHNQAGNYQAATAADVVAVGGKKHDSKAAAAPTTTGAGAGASTGTVGESLKHARSLMAAANKTDAHKINLNIFLSQAIRATTEHEIANSDVDSSSEAAEPNSTTHLQSCKSYLGPNRQSNPAAVAGATGESVNAETKLAATRRAQFQTIRNAAASNTFATPITSSTLSPVPPAVVAANSTNGGGANIFSASPSLTVQRRPPLVRAMSAPVRSFDENSKSAIASGKRKSRRRKLVAPRNLGCDQTDEASVRACDGSAEVSGKHVLSRTRSTLAADVITLVSLISSEGSDSEKEDTSTTTTATNSDQSPTRRAPSLRKTGKSVSFQENYPANFQLASKEYSQMIRRGSVAPIAARIRGNRPPTAPPVSIFFNDKTNKSDAMPANSSSRSNAQITASQNVSLTAEKENNAEDYIFPEYVRSIKERECWKLYQKMCTKGVTVTYDTILRGMLTPTEFRQLQKQRDIEEAKVRDAEEAAGAVTEKPKSQPTPIERLSETLLKK